MVVGFGVVGEGLGGGDGSVVGECVGEELGNNDGPVVGLFTGGSDGNDVGLNVIKQNPKKKH